MDNSENQPKAPPKSVSQANNDSEDNFNRIGPVKGTKI
jgi:hypothetical protein